MIETEFDLTSISVVLTLDPAGVVATLGGSGLIDRPIESGRACLSAMIVWHRLRSATSSQLIDSSNRCKVLGALLWFNAIAATLFR